MTPTFICAQPRTLYYAWQLEVMIMNFIESGIDPGSIEVLLAYSTDPNSATNSRDTLWIFDRLREAHPRVRFYDYLDTRPDTSRYVSSIRPHIMSKHFSAMPRMSKSVIFYHDCDIIFTASPDFSGTMGDNTCYLSDAASYISANYLVSKDRELYEKMCGVVGIDPSVPMSNNHNSGGAQYVLKGVDAGFWQKVESDCESIYSLLSDEEDLRSASMPGYDPIQKWTSDMWSLLWNLWLGGKSVRTHPSLRFCWATDPISMVGKYPILHNAGVTGPGRHFFKQDYVDRLPYSERDRFDNTACSHHYFQQVVRYGESSCLR